MNDSNIQKLGQALAVILINGAVEAVEARGCADNLRAGGVDQLFVMLGEAAPSVIYDAMANAKNPDDAPASQRDALVRAKVLEAGVRIGNAYCDNVVRGTVVVNER